MLRVGRISNSGLGRPLWDFPLIVSFDLPSKPKVKGSGHLCVCVSGTTGVSLNEDTWVEELKASSIPHLSVSITLLCLYSAAAALHADLRSLP